MPKANPPATRPTGRVRLLAALLDVGADELLGVLLEHFVDLIEDRVHVVGELLVPLLDLFGRRRLVLFGLVGAPRRLPLAPLVIRRHLRYLLRRGACPSTVLTLSSPAGVPPNPAHLHWNEVATRPAHDPLLLLGKGGDQLGGGLAAVEQAADVRLGAAQGLERGDPLERVAR